MCPGKGRRGARAVPRTTHIDGLQGVQTNKMQKVAFSIATLGCQQSKLPHLSAQHASCLETALAEKVSCMLHLGHQACCCSIWCPPVQIKDSRRNVLRSPTFGWSGGPEAIPQCWFLIHVPIHVGGGTRHTKPSSISFHCYLNMEVSVPYLCPLDV